MEAEQRIAIQEDIIEKLAAQGHSTVEAEKILKTFTDTLKTMYAHRDTIMAELEMAYKNSN